MKINKEIQQEYAKYAIKGGLAALLALIIAYLLHIQQSYWVLFGAVTVTKLHMGASFQRGKQRIYGTLLGVAISLLLALFLLHWPLSVAIIIPLCVFGAVYYFSYYSIAMIFITVLFVLVFGIISHHPIYYGIARIFDTALGVTIAILVTLYIWPNRMSLVLEREFQAYFSYVIILFEKFSQAFINGALTIEEKNSDLKLLITIMLKSKDGFALIEHEPGKKPDFYKQDDSLLLRFDRLYSAMNILGSLAVEKCDFTSEANLVHLLADFTQKAQVQLSLTTDSSMMIENEIKNILAHLNKLSLVPEQLSMIAAFIQAVCDVVAEIQCARRVSQNLCIAE